MERLADDFEMLAPDFRCFGHSSALPIDATRGMRDFSDDIAEFLHAVGWDRFHLFGWSMGGGVAMQYAIDHPRQVQSLILQAPLSPFGFGGSYEEAGAPVEPAGLGSGAACTNQALLQAIRTGDRTLPGQVIDSVYVAAGYKLPEAQREKYIDSILLCKTGDDMCPVSYTHLGQLRLSRRILPVQSERRRSCSSCKRSMRSFEISIAADYSRRSVPS